MISGLCLSSDSGLKKGENKKLKYLFACLPVGRFTVK
jgi:hypothetical protein